MSCSRCRQELSADGRNPSLIDTTHRCERCDEETDHPHDPHTLEQCVESLGAWRRRARRIDMERRQT